VKKKIFFNQISILNFSLIILFKLLNYEIYFIKLEKKIRKQKLIRILKQFDIKWFNYQEYNLKQPHLKIDIQAKKLADDSSKKVTNLVWGSKLQSYFSEKQNLNVCLHEKFVTNYKKNLEIYEIANKYKDNNRIYIWLQKNNYTAEVEKKFDNVINLYPKILTFLSVFTSNIINFIYIISKLITNRIFSLFTKSNNKNIERNIKNLKVAFFPHKGVISKNYKKDYFYSENKNSPFYYSNIIHIEWDEKDIIKNNLQNNFYDKKNIPVIYWNSLKRKNSVFKIKLIIDLISIYISLMKKIDNSISIDLIFILLKIENCKEKILNYPNIKIALIGYDILFPQTLATACRIKNIKLIAAQDRTHIPILGFQFLLDKYFVVGKHSEIALKHKIDQRMQIIKTGIVKTKQHLNEKKKLKINNEEKFDFKCLVIDRHSLKDWYDNGRSYALNWKINLDFYEDINNLAKKNQNILFLIKSKNYDWTKIPYFQNILKEFKFSSNIIILNDPYNWTPTNCLTNTNFGIAKMSSLADEMLVLNKPIIIYEKDDPSFVYDYGTEILSQSFTDLENKVFRIKKDIENYNKSLGVIREKFYTKFDEKKINSELDKINSINE